MTDNSQLRFWKQMDAFKVDTFVIEKNISSMRFWNSFIKFTSLLLILTSLIGLNQFPDFKKLWNAFGLVVTVFFFMDLYFHWNDKIYFYSNLLKIKNSLFNEMEKSWNIVSSGKLNDDEILKKLQQYKNKNNKILSSYNNFSVRYSKQYVKYAKKLTTEYFGNLY